MSVETFDVNTDALQVTPAAAAYLKKQLGQSGIAHQCAGKWLYRLHVCHG